jgi:hypothetical protein
MDKEKERPRTSWLYIWVMLFFISGTGSYVDLVYFVNGHDIAADVIKSYEKQSRRGSPRLVIEYAFTEPDGTPRNGVDSVSLDRPDPAVPQNGKVAVRYTAGADGSSRLDRRAGWLFLYLFAFSIVGLGVFGFHRLREAVGGPKPPVPEPQVG